MSTLQCTPHKLILPVFMLVFHYFLVQIGTNHIEFYMMRTVLFLHILLFLHSLMRFMALQIHVDGKVSFYSNNKTLA